MPKPTVTAWAHLPNAVHIDRILADVRARPEVWDAARYAARYDARYAARDAAWNAARDAARYAARDAAWNAARYAARVDARVAAWDAAWDALAALIAWDDSAALLDMPPDALRMLYLTETEYAHAAVLLLPAVIALNSK